LISGTNELSAVSANQEHIGLHNVLTRLTLQYSEATLALEPHAPYGLKVILRIPVPSEPADKEEHDESDHR
jgi:LytS/YehU family sensor histidine kinase